MELLTTDRTVTDGLAQNSEEPILKKAARDARSCVPSAFSVGSPFRLSVPARLCPCRSVINRPGAIQSLLIRHQQMDQIPEPQDMSS